LIGSMGGGARIVSSDMGQEIAAGRLRAKMRMRY
jgi:hypothetical protein